MIPLWMSLAVRTPKGTTIRLGLPLFLVWLVALPSAVLLAPVALVACALMRLNPLLPIAALWGLLRGMRGTHVEIDGPHSFVFMHVY